MAEVFSKSRLLSYFSNPLVLSIAALASIISIPLAFYFYFMSVARHELTYYINPAKAIVAKSGVLSKLSVSFDGVPITSDIAVAQIALWNTGKMSIREGDVLQPVIISTENNTPILDAVIRKTSRDVIHLSLDVDDLEKGCVAVSWKILEKDDGGIIQVTYAGDPDLDINVKGVIEGQKKIAQITSPRNKGYHVLKYTLVLLLLFYIPPMLYKILPNVIRPYVPWLVGILFIYFGYMLLKYGSQPLIPLFGF